MALCATNESLETYRTGECANVSIKVNINIIKKYMFMGFLLSP